MLKVYLFECELPLLAQFPPGFINLLVSIVSGLYLILVLSYVCVPFPRTSPPPKIFALYLVLLRYGYWICMEKFAIDMKCVDFQLSAFRLKAPEKAC